MQAGFCGSCAADVGLRPTAGSLGSYPSTLLPTYKEMDNLVGCWLVLNGSDQCAIQTRDAFNLVDS